MTRINDLFCTIDGRASHVRTSLLYKLSIYKTRSVEIIFESWGHDGVVPLPPDSDRSSRSPSHLNDTLHTKTQGKWIITFSTVLLGTWPVPRTRRRGEWSKRLVRLVSQTQNQRGSSLSLRHCREGGVARTLVVYSTDTFVKIFVPWDL